MPFGKDAPIFFATLVDGITFEGPNAIVSFALPIPSADFTTREYLTAVRVAIPIDALKQSLNFIDGALSRQKDTSATIMPTPDIAQ